MNITSIHSNIIGNNRLHAAQPSQEIKNNPQVHSGERVSLSEAGKQAAMFDRYQMAAHSSKPAEGAADAPSVRQEHTLEILIPKAEKDPKMAGELAYNLAFSTDLMLVNLEAIKDDPYKMAAAGKEAEAFDKVSQQVTQQRIAIYNAMKAEGSSDIDIIKAFVEFNHALPESYQLQAGMFKHQWKGHY